MVDEMTERSLAAGTEMEFVPDPDYQPGVCNIGPAEIQRRRMAGHVGLVAFLAVLSALVVTDAPALLRLLVIAPAAVAASGYLQARLRFCANYGWRGIFNLGEIGDDGLVADPRALAADRRMALRIGLWSLAIGLVAGIVAVALPI